MEQQIFFETGEGMALTGLGGSMIFKAIGDTTDGTFSLMERVLPVSNRRPFPHRHQGPEGFYILEGSLEFIVAGESRVGGPGFWALIPPGVVHTFGNAGTTPARVLIIHAPAAEAYFVELQALLSQSEPPTVEEELALMRKHGVEPVLD